MRRPSIRSASLLMGLVAGLCLSPAVGRAATARQIPVMQITAEADVAAPPAAVWAYLTTGKNFVTWCPMWKSAANAKVALTKVGDSVDFLDEYGNGGRSVVTYLVPNREIRISHDPTDGSYVCQARLILTPAGTGTHVKSIEHYTDESKPEDMKATAEKTRGEMDQMLAAVKKALEGAK